MGGPEIDVAPVDYPTQLDSVESHFSASINALASDAPGRLINRLIGFFFLAVPFICFVLSAITDNTAYWQLKLDLVIPEARSYNRDLLAYGLLFTLAVCILDNLQTLQAPLYLATTVCFASTQFLPALMTFITNCKADEMPNPIPLTREVFGIGVAFSCIKFLLKTAVLAISTMKVTIIALRAHLRIRDALYLKKIIFIVSTVLGTLAAFFDLLPHCTLVGQLIFQSGECLGALPDPMSIIIMGSSGLQRSISSFFFSAAVPLLLYYRLSEDGSKNNIGLVAQRVASLCCVFLALAQVYCILLASGGLHLMIISEKYLAGRAECYHPQLAIMVASPVFVFLISIVLSVFLWKY